MHVVTILGAAAASFNELQVQLLFEGNCYSNKISTSKYWIWINVDKTSLAGWLSPPPSLQFIILSMYMIITITPSHNPLVSVD